MKEDEEWRFIISLRRGGRSSRLGFKEVDIDIVDSDDARGDTRWKTGE